VGNTTKNGKRCSLLCRFKSCPVRFFISKGEYMIKECEMCGEEFEAEDDTQDMCNDCSMAEYEEADGEYEDPSNYGA
jgi:hypothetical protein